jgi:acyl-CoA reductase-like NAD-dependent aldehyde dehydrogenase
LKQNRVVAGPGEWSELSSKQRGDLLYRLAELIDQEKEALALLGTSLSLSLRAPRT